jgi:cysteine desulfurase / selenocysteine lyase
VALAPRQHFPFADEVTYLNSASIGLVPVPVQKQATAFEADIWRRGTTGFDEAAETGVLEAARVAGAELLHASPDDVAVTKSATEALCQVAWWVRPAANTNVVAIDVDHPSTVYPWTRVVQETGAELRLLRVWDDPGSLSLERVAEVVDGETSVIAVSLTQYSTGFTLDLAKLAELAHEHGTLAVVDATQAAGQVPIDVTTSDVDVLVAGGYKWLCGAFGAALCYLRPELRELFDPPLVGWRSTVDPYVFDSRTLPLAPSARRLEFSTMGYGSAVALGGAIRYVLDLGVERVAAHNLALSSALIAGLDELGANVLTPRDDAARCGIVMARFPGHDGEQVAARLNEAGVIVSPRFSAARFSLHYFNDEDDVGRALEVLERILAPGQDH